jgi:hypothetical protein
MTQSKDVSEAMPKVMQFVTGFSLQRPESIQGNSCGIVKGKVAQADFSLSTLVLTCLLLLHLCFMYHQGLVQ